MSLTANTPCCEMMSDQLSLECAQHPDRSDCPDALVGFFSDGRVGLFIHDGGQSMLLMAFCPWCGSATGTDIDNRPLNPSSGCGR